MSNVVDDLDLISRAGFDRLEAQIEQLVTVRRREVARRLRDARAEGERAGENADIEDALEEQALLERRIADLGQRVASARIVEPVDDGTAHIGAFVRLRAASGGTADYQLVGAAEFDPSTRRISVESPVGEALLGRRAGDVIVVDAPAGARRLEIASIYYASETKAA